MKLCPPLLSAGLAAALSSGCVWQRTGEPFVATLAGADLAQNGISLGWSDSGNTAGFGHSCGCCFMLTGGPLLDLVGLPVDLAIQAFGPARIRVVDENGDPVEGADATVLIDCGAPDDTELHRRTGPDGSFRLRRRVSKDNLLGGRVIWARIEKEGYCTVRAGDFSAFARTNVVTVTMPRFVPGAGHVVERAEDDPAGLFPPWPETEGRVAIDCRRGRVVPWDWDVRWYDAKPHDLELEVETTTDREGRPVREICLFPPEPGPEWWNAPCVAVAPVGPEGPDVVPADSAFKHRVVLDPEDFAGDEPRKAVYFRAHSPSPDDPHRYARIEFRWKDGLPVGIRRVLYSDAPGERDLRFTAPPPIPVADDPPAP